MRVAFVLVGILLGLTIRLNRCRTLITNSFRDNASLFKLSCDSVVINNIYGLTFTVVLLGSSIGSIIGTYTKITLRARRRGRTGRGQNRGEGRGGEGKGRRERRGEERRERRGEEEREEREERRGGERGEERRERRGEERRRGTEHRNTHKNTLYNGSAGPEVIMQLRRRRYL
ncbi:hypothetical protein D4764_14G0005610 [Takifugu flavidus]|uniref:Uncharacterized protein n=1 Tax=Takifugu flavidus TaxID=433684 RepID=A0A5C6P6P5_9TELE|nr:hypothetical protein D4764_14G0005610 [Takifugu flavidus]